MNLRRLQWKRKGKGQRGLLVAAVLLAVCTVFVLARRAMMNTLLRHATRYADVGVGSKVFLLSDHEALVLSTNCQAFRMDIERGNQESIAPLSSLLRKVPAGNLVLLSPDTKWLRWDGWPRAIISSYNPLEEIMALDASEHWHGKGDSWLFQRSQPFWSSDSGFLMHVEREEDHFTLTYKPHNFVKKQSKTIKIPPGAPLALRQQDTRFSSHASDVEAIGWTNPHQLLTAFWTGYLSTSLSFYELNTDNTTKPARWWNVKTPQNKYVGKIMLSPQGNRLAWQATSDWESVGNNPLGRLADRWPTLRRYSIFNPQSHWKLWLFTSRLDGSDIHDLGSIEQHGDPMVVSSIPSPKERLEHLQWTPDGKQLLFVYCGTIYTVPAQ